MKLSHLSLGKAITGIIGASKSPDGCHRIQFTDIVLLLFSSGVVNLTFLAYVVGGFLSVRPSLRHSFLSLTSYLAISGFFSQPLQENAYHRISARLGYPSPEARWWSSLWATFFLPLGLFIAAWTSYSHIPFIAPLVSRGRPYLIVVSYFVLL